MRFFFKDGTQGMRNTPDNTRHAFQRLHLHSRTGRAIIFSRTSTLCRLYHSPFVDAKGLILYRRAARARAVRISNQRLIKLGKLVLILARLPDHTSSVYDFQVSKLRAQWTQECNLCTMTKLFLLAVKNKNHTMMNSIKKVNDDRMSS